MSERGFISDAITDIRLDRAIRELPDVHRILARGDPRPQLQRHPVPAMQRAGWAVSCPDERHQALLSAETRLNRARLLTSDVACPHGRRRRCAPRARGRARAGRGPLRSARVEALREGRIHGRGRMRARRVPPLDRGHRRVHPHRGRTRPARRPPRERDGSRRRRHADRRRARGRHRQDARHPRGAARGPAGLGRAGSVQPGSSDRAPPDRVHLRARSRRRSRRRRSAGT